VTLIAFLNSEPWWYWLLFVLAVLAFVGLAFAPYASWREAQEEMEDRREFERASQRIIRAELERAGGDEGRAA